jgi:hypothetical protein
MRRSFLLFGCALSLIFGANTALAQKKPKDKKKEAEGPSAAATWTDPIDKEQSDKGPYTPHKDESDAPKPEPKRAPDKGRQRDKLVAYGQLIIGFGKAPLNNAAFEPSGKGTVLGILLGGRYDVSKELSAGLRIPVTTASVKQTDGTNLSSTAFGAPELLGEYRLSIDRLTSVPLLFGIGIPIAQGNPDETATLDRPGQTKDLVNKLADSTSGWRDSELFQPKRLPIVLGGGIHHDKHDWEAHADAKFVFLPALGTSLQSANIDMRGTYKRGGFALREVTTLGASYNFLAKPLLYGGLDFALIWSPLPTFDFEANTGSVSRPSPFQAVLEPKVGARFGSVSPSVGYILPLGGRLGSAGNGGIRLLVSAAF